MQNILCTQRPKVGGVNLVELIGQVFGFDVGDVAHICAHILQRASDIARQPLYFGHPLGRQCHSTGLWIVFFLHDNQACKDTSVTVEWRSQDHPTHAIQRGQIRPRSPNYWLNTQNGTQRSIKIVLRMPKT